MNCRIPIHSGRLLLLASGLILGCPQWAQAGEPADLETRVACKTALEDWRHGHRIWPDDNPNERPARSELLADAEIAVRAAVSLDREQRLARQYGWVIDQQQIQAELDRLARSTRLPGRLAELFALFEHDPDRIGDCLARPQLVERLWARFEDKAVLDLPDLGQPMASSSDQGLSLPTILAEPESESETGEGWRVMGFPEGRYGHSSVWTGTEMIIWGGFSGGRPLNTGSRYDPLTDTWTGIALAQAPEPRGDHVATWTGTQMLVWGGSVSQASQLASGGRYDPVADQWTPISQAGAPSPRGRSASVWSGSEWLIWGGYSPPFLLFGDGARYNPHSDSWQPISPLGAPDARYDHRAVWTGGEMIIWGGRVAGSSFLGSGARYNPTSDSWTETRSEGAPSPRVGHSAVWTGELMIVWGGRDPAIVNTGAMYRPDTDSWESTNTDDTPGTREWHGAVWTGTEMLIWGGSWPSYPVAGGRFDPQSNSWTPMSAANAPQGRESHSLVWTGEELLVWGGTRGSGGALTSGARYSPALDAWQGINDHNAPPARNTHVSVWTGSEKLIWGGDGSRGARYDPVLDVWTAMSIGDAPQGRIRASAIWTGSEMIVWGGISGVVLNTGGRYNPAADSWQATSLANAPSARQWHSAVWTGEQMIVWGGANSEILDDGGRYDPASDQWHPLPGDDPPLARVEHTAVWTGTEMLVWGGRQSLSTRLNSGGRYSPASQSWTPTSLDDAPAGRYHHSAVWTGQELIVWSGNGGGQTGGVYDPAADAWRPTATADVPIWRQGGQATVWTGSEMIVWGGWTTASIVVTGGRYDPVTDSWQATSTHGTPGARDGASAVWTGSEMVIWGGQSNAVAVYDPAMPLPGPVLRLLAVEPSPSRSGQLATVVVELLDEFGTAPVDGQVQIWADSGESCTDPGPPSAAGSSAVFACQLAFATAGERQLGAGFSGSSSHADIDSGDALWRHRVISDEFFAIGGQVSGLLGSGLALILNQDEILPIENDGPFQFDTMLDDAASWALGIQQQPSAPAQTCLIESASGRVDGIDVSHPIVFCQTNHYSVGGEVIGLEGTGLVLELNNTQSLGIPASGPFSFPLALADQSAYLVTVAASPTGPAQTCTVVNAGGVIAGADVDNVRVECQTNLYRVGGLVSGLTGQGLILDNKQEEQRAISGNGSFHFPTLHPEGTAYDVTVFGQPSQPAQSCSISNGTGVVGIGDVSSIQVSCLSLEYVVSAASGAGGSVSPSGPVYVAAGESASFELLPDQGFGLLGIDGNCGGTIDGLIYITDPVMQDCAFEARFQFLGPVALQVVSSPGTSVVEHPLKPALEVHVANALGERVVDDQFTVVTVSLLEHDSGAQLGGPVQLTVVDGAARFEQLLIDRPGEGYRLQVSDLDGLLSSDQSEPFDVRVDRMFSDRFEASE